MKRTKTKAHLSVPKPIHLDFDIEDSHFANALAMLTINWGRIEHQLFLILLFIDEKHAPAYTKAFFQNEAIAHREKVLRSEISAAMEKDYPDFIVELDAQLEVFRSIRIRRNPLAHGLWERTGPKQFSVAPLRLADGSDDVAKPINVDLTYVVTLLNDIHRMMSSLAWLGAQMQIHQYAKRRDKRNK
jgi:hypothetical protein